MEPVVLNVLVMTLYAVFAVVLYLQVAALSVVTPSITEPEDCIPVGVPPEIIGGQVFWVELYVHPVQVQFG